MYSEGLKIFQLKNILNKKYKNENKNKNCNN